MCPQREPQLEFPYSLAQHRAHYWKITCKQHQRNPPRPHYLPSTDSSCALTAAIALPSAAQPSDSCVRQILPSTNPRALHAKTLQLTSPAQSTTACARGDFVGARYLTASEQAKTYLKGSSPERAGSKNPKPKTRCLPRSKPRDSYMRCSGIWPRPRGGLSIQTPHVVRNSSGKRSNRPSPASCRCCFHWMFSIFTPR